MKYLILLVLATSIAGAQKNSVTQEARTGYQSILKDDLLNHLKVLTSDSLQGRETGYPGAKKAAEYIASKFKKFGLKPLAPSGSFLQPYEVETTRLSENSTLTVDNNGSRVFRWLHDYIGFGSPETTLTGPIVFVGCMDAKLDSITAARIQGHFVVVLNATKSASFDTTRNSLRRRLFQMRNDKGTLGTLIVGDDTGSGSFGRTNVMLHSFVEKGQMRIKGTPARSSQTRNLYFQISDSAASSIFSSRGLSLKEARTLAFQDTFTPLFMDSCRIAINQRLDRETKTAYNVAGMIEGSDRTLNDEYVLFTAHYDHLGVSGTGDVFRGADDDGSGTATVLELAEAFALNKAKPKRSLVFLTVSGEEQGLLGSSYYVNNPLVPLAKTMADYNIDMIGRSDPHHDSLSSAPYVYVIGSDKISTELDDLLREANRESENILLDYQYNDENDPNQFYRRSDHYNFAKNGVPIAFFFTGEHRDYHKPTDTIDKILFERMVKIGRMIYWTGWKSANRNKSFEHNVEVDTPKQ